MPAAPIGWPSVRGEERRMSGTRAPVLPIKVDPTSNGEFRPVPLPEAVAAANALAARRIGEHARRLGVARRTFLRSLCGAATTLATLNEAFAAEGNTGGSFVLPKEATL